MKKVIKKISQVSKVLPMLWAMGTTKIGRILKNVLEEEKISFINMDMSAMILDDDGNVEGFQRDKFIYAGSLPKIYIAAAVFLASDQGRCGFGLNRMIPVNPNNISDPKDEVFNPDFALRSGETISVKDLLSRMIEYSDNTAANELIDLVGLDFINKKIIEAHNWQGSEVTRKFLPRKKDFGNENAPATVTCAAHVVEFLELLKNGQLLGRESTELFLKLLSQCKTGAKVPSDFPEGSNYAHKSGWLEIFKNGKFYKYVSDAGIITTNGGKTFIVCYMSMLKTIDREKNFPSKKLTKKLFEFLNK